MFSTASRPSLKGDNLLAAGVLMEGYSVEDDGDETRFVKGVFI